MPSSQPLLTSRLRGYVCKSCSLRLQKPPRPQAPWLSRSIMSENGGRVPKLSKIQKSTPTQSLPSGSTIKYFEQTPDGERRELDDDPDEEMLRQTVEATLRSYDETMMKKSEELGISIEELEKRHGMSEEELEEGLDTFGGEMAEEDLHGHFSGEGWSQQWSTEDFEEMASASDFDGSMSEEFFMKQMTEQERGQWDEQERMTSEMEAQMKKWKELDNISEEDRQALRRELLAGIVYEEDSRQQAELNDESSFAIDPPVEAASKQLKQLPQSAKDNQLTSSEILSGVTIPKDEFPDEYKKRITALNNSLQRASRLLKQNKLGDNVQKEAWQSYMVCSKILLRSPESVPMNVWSLLWDIFEQPNERNHGRMEHIFRLGNDMKIANVPFRGRQHVLYIEARFMEGARKAAIQDWENHKSSLGEDASTFQSFWIIGIRMYSELGDARKSLAAVAEFLQQSQDAQDYRLLLPVIKAYLNEESPTGLRTAWAAYEQLKWHLGSLMRMEDYDAVISLFLKANKTNQALQIFTDMMLAGERYQKRKRIADESEVFLDLANVENNVEQPVVLPSELNNKFFFGKWIKKLIGDGDIAGAKKVFDLMRERGIRADARHMNGLIGALYRSKFRGDHRIGHEMAWQMIEARLEFVKRRDLSLHSRGKVRVIASENKPDYMSPLLMPIATIETFSILLEQYRRGQRKDDIERLCRTLEEARIRPDTYFMNQMILSDWRSRSTERTWEMYQDFVRKWVKPDFDTYNYLWGVMKKASDPMTREDFMFTTCRELFRNMIGQAKSLTRKESMPKEVYDAILLAFSLRNDQAGTAVALRALQKHFNMYPTADTARTIVLQLTRAEYRVSQWEPKAGESTKTKLWGHRPRRLNLRRHETTDRVQQVTKIFASFKKQRLDALQERGIVYEELSEEEKAEEALLLLSDLLRYAAQARLDSSTDWAQPKTADVKSRQAADMMGVPDCDPWAEPTTLQS
ncbi:hypothetical protein B0O99DRAFT_735234 [Bisporella sp. PMI_857]|nr:hypothetical protein B0O99DRAFT_735234 [Bisporella sp. PMI_857]